MNYELVRSLKVLAVQLFFVMTFGLAGLSKWKGGVPAWFGEQFGKTWFGSKSKGLAASYYGIATAETLAFLGFAASLVAREAFGRPPIFLQGSLLLSLFIFTSLAYGQRLTFKFQDAAFSFLYFAGTLVCMISV